MAHGKKCGGFIVNITLNNFSIHTTEIIRFHKLKMLWYSNSVASNVKVLGSNPRKSKNRSNLIMHLERNVLLNKSAIWINVKCIIKHTVRIQFQTTTV